MHRRETTGVIEIEGDAVGEQTRVWGALAVDAHHLQAQFWRRVQRAEAGHVVERSDDAIGGDEEGLVDPVAIEHFGLGRLLVNAKLRARAGNDLGSSGGLVLAGPADDHGDPSGGQSERGDTCRVCCGRYRAHRDCGTRDRNAGVSDGDLEGPCRPGFLRGRREVVAEDRADENTGRQRTQSEHMSSMVIQGIDGRLCPKVTCYSQNACCLPDVEAL